MNTEKVKLLIVDDDEDDFYLTSEYLKEIPSKQFDIIWASSFGEGVKRLSQVKFDLCFFDFLIENAKFLIFLLFLQNAFSFSF